MWNSNEIKQGDSGLVVSNKLDAEFQRSHAEESRVANRLLDLEYTDKITVLDKIEDKKIVSPYTMWFAMEPVISDVDLIKDVTQHLSERVFTGGFWIQTDALVEYTGPYVPVDRLNPGTLVSRAHIDELESELLLKAVLVDGSVDMSNGYVPSRKLSVATKDYVDTRVASAVANMDSEVFEFPSSSDGDTVFSVHLGTNDILVYVNGVLQRSTKYGRDQFKVTFIKPLSENDEVTIARLGDKV